MEEGIVGGGIETYNGVPTPEERQRSAQPTAQSTVSPYGTADKGSVSGAVSAAATATVFHPAERTREQEWR